MIEEARRRQRRRRAEGVAFGVLAAIVAGALWLCGGGGRGGGDEPGAGGRPLKLALVHGEALSDGGPALMGLAPSLQAGNVGVCVRVVGSEGCNGPPPSLADPVYGGEGGVNVEEQVGPAGEIDALFVGPGVAAVRVAHVGTFGARHAAGLPPQAKEVVFYRAPGSRGSVLSPGTSPDVLRGFEHGRGGPALTETLLDDSGHVIPVRPQPTFTLPNSYWQGAEAPPAGGRCGMRSAFPGVSTQWGEVADEIAADHNITVPAWLTCEHVWYTAGAAAFETAILLNASAPGAAPAPLWGAVRAPGHPGIVEIPPRRREISFRIPTPSRAVLERELALDTKRGGRAQAEALIHQVERAASPRGETYWQVFVPPTVARRVGPAWLVVRYGDSLTQRIAFLESLHVTRIALPRR